MPQNPFGGPFCSNSLDTKKGLGSSLDNMDSRGGTDLAKDELSESREFLLPAGGIQLEDY